MLIIKPNKNSNETIDRMLKRYKKKVDSTKLVRAVKGRRNYTKPSEVRRIEIKKAQLRERYKREHELL